MNYVRKQRCSCCPFFYSAQIILDQIILLCFKQYYLYLLFLSKRRRPQSRTVASVPRPPDIRNVIYCVKCWVLEDGARRPPSYLDYSCSNTIKNIGQNHCEHWVKPLRTLSETIKKIA